MSVAEREFKRAIELNPGYATAHHWYAINLMWMARFDEAIRVIKRTLELNPLPLAINRNVGWIFYSVCQCDQAIEALQKTIEMDPNFSQAHLLLGKIYLQKSIYEEALTELQKEKELSISWKPIVEAWIGITYVRMGKIGEALEVLDDLLKRSKEAYVSPYCLANFYFAFGESDQEFKWLEKAYEERDFWLIFLKIDPAFDSIRSDPRFTELLKKMGLEK